MWLICLLPLFLLSVYAKCPTDTFCDESFNKCFKYITDTEEYFSAEEKCVSYGGHLASIQNSFEQLIIGETAESMFYGATDYWIGANYVLNNKWSWTDGTPFTYHNWFPGEPSSQEAVSVTIKSNLWSSVNPEQAKPYVCSLPYKNSTTDVSAAPSQSTACPVCQTCRAPCDSGWMYFEYSNSCYKQFFNEEFLTAESICIQNGAHLTSIHSEEENDFVSDFASSGREETASGATWIGFHLIQGNWFWTDNSTVDYFGWASTEPHNGECARIYPYGQYGSHKYVKEWVAYSCSDKIRNFVCKKPAY